MDEFEGKGMTTASGWMTWRVLKWFDRIHQTDLRVSARCAQGMLADGRVESWIMQTMQLVWRTRLSTRVQTNLGKIKSWHSCWRSVNKHATSKVHQTQRLPQQPTSRISTHHRTKHLDHHEPINNAWTLRERLVHNAPVRIPSAWAENKRPFQPHTILESV